MARGLILLMLLAACGGGRRTCTDPCPGAISREVAYWGFPETGATYLIECTTTCGAVMVYQSAQGEESACWENIEKWERLVQGCGEQSRPQSCGLRGLRCEGNDIRICTEGAEKSALFQKCPEGSTCVQYCGNMIDGNLPCCQRRRDG